MVHIPKFFVFILHYLLDIILSIAIIVTGGGKDRDLKIKHDKIEGALTSVELLHDDGSPWCTLPDLPQQMKHHSQTGLEACGGAWHYFCVKFNKGNTILFG